jgi:hypothetical protein
MSDLIQALEDVWQQAAAPSVTIGVMEHLRYEQETKRLREILGREPTIWDRLEYRICWELARPVRQMRHGWSDEAKICDAAWEDAGKSKSIW